MIRRVLGFVVVCAVLALAWWFGVRGPSIEGIVLPSIATPDIAAPAPTAPGIPPEAFPMTVESVHDGDTLRAHVDAPNAVVTDTASTRIRLLGIDTPEISPQVDCWGAEATGELSALAPAGSTIWAAPDLDVYDQYGRHLLYLWTPDGVFINAELVSRGAARVEIYAPNDAQEALLRRLEAQARDAGVGRWSACP